MHQSYKYSKPSELDLWMAEKLESASLAWTLSSVFWMSFGSGQMDVGLANKVGGEAFSCPLLKQWQDGVALNAFGSGIKSEDWKCVEIPILVFLGFFPSWTKGWNVHDSGGGAVATSLWNASRGHGVGFRAGGPGCLTVACVVVSCLLIIVMKRGYHVILEEGLFSNKTCL